MPNVEEFQDATEGFQIMGDVSRLRIFWVLCHTEECGICIAEAVNMTAAAVSHHLKILSMNDLITSHRNGKEVYYALAQNKRAKLLHKMVDDYFQLTCPNKGID
jgi:DNA-binding transcriptional ArsR family regulator